MRRLRRSCGFRSNAFTEVLTVSSASRSFSTRSLPYCCSYVRMSRAWRSASFNMFLLDFRYQWLLAKKSACPNTCAITRTFWRYVLLLRRNACDGTVLSTSSRMLNTSLFCWVTSSLYVPPVPVDEPVRQAHARDLGDLVAVRHLEDHRIEGEAPRAREALNLLDHALVLADHAHAPTSPLATVLHPSTSPGSCDS